MEIKTIFKKNIEDVKPYEPGKPIRELQREMGIRHVVKLASNENPLGPSRKALAAMRKTLLESHLYPEGSCYYLVGRLARELGVGTEQIIIGNGSNEIIELLARGFLSPGDQVVSSETSFLVYPILSKVVGAEFVEVPMKNFKYDLRGILKAITPRTKIIFIANPNNPTGTYVTTSEVEEFLSKVPKNVLVCFDEAYLDFVDAADFPHMLFHIKAQKPNVFILRTFSKAYGLAGLRVGYGVGNPEIIQYLHKIRQPFNVNSVAQAGATAALDDRFFLWRTKRLVIRGKKYFYRRLDQLKLKYLATQANFVLVDTGGDGDALVKYMMSEGVIIRSMKPYRLPGWVRVTIGRRSQNALFFRILKRYLSRA